MQTAFATQFEYDNAGDDSNAADSLETECTIFAERFCENQMDPQTFFELAEAFGGETLGDYLAEDDQQNLLQLVLAHADETLAKPIIAALYAAAYKHREGELK